MPLLKTISDSAVAGRIFAELKRVGRVMQQIDMQIGAIVRTLPNCVAVSKDTDLSAIYSREHRR